MPFAALARLASWRGCPSWSCGIGLACHFKVGMRAARIESLTGHQPSGAQQRLPTGLEELKKTFIELSKAPPEQPKGKDRKVIGWGTGGPLYADEIASSRRESAIRLALQEIADAQGDVDAFIAQQSEKAKTVPRVATEIAQRLLNRAVLMRHGALSMPSMKKDLVGFRSNGSRYALK